MERATFEFENTGNLITNREVKYYNNQSDSLQNLCFSQCNFMFIGVFFINLRRERENRKKEFC